MLARDKSRYAGTSAPPHPQAFMLLYKPIVELEFIIAQLGARPCQQCKARSSFEKKIDRVFQRAPYGSIGPIDVRKQSGLLLLII